MIAFKVSLDGKHLCTAGVRNLGVLSAIVTWIRRKPETSRSRKVVDEELTLDVGALDSVSDQHLRWLSRRLRVGHQVTIDVVDVAKVDKPKRRHRRDPKLIARAKRRYYERLKKEFDRGRR
jgi:hypothetical protein